MSKKYLASIKGTWDKNIPTFISSKSPQQIFDVFMALKYNINDAKIVSYLLHRFLGDYREKFKGYYSDVFKQLKQWLFGSYRTEHISQLSYLAINKGYNTYKDLKASLIKDKKYKTDIALLYPEEEYVCVTTEKIEEPLFFIYKPRKIFKEVNNKLENITKVFYSTNKEEDQADTNGIPFPKTVANSNIQTLKMFEYMNRNFFKFPCEYCREHLTVETMAITNCSHLCHKSCLKDGLYCYCCENQTS